jgi:hypothetical protein
VCRRFDPAPDHFRPVPPIVAKSRQRKYVRRFDSLPAFFVPFVTFRRFRLLFAGALVAIYYQFRFAIRPRRPLGAPFGVLGLQIGQRIQRSGQIRAAGRGNSGRSSRLKDAGVNVRSSLPRNPVPSATRYAIARTGPESRKFSFEMRSTWASSRASSSGAGVTSARPGCDSPSPWA